MASFSQSSEQTTVSLAASLGKSDSRGPASGAWLGLWSCAMLVAVGARFDLPIVRLDSGVLEFWIRSSRSQDGVDL